MWKKEGKRVTRFWSLRLFETAGSHVVCSIFEGEERGR